MIPEKQGGALRHDSIQPFDPTEYPCYIKEDDHPYATAGADAPSQAFAFVRGTTPHYSGTSRGGSYSVTKHSTPYCNICKSPFGKYRYYCPHFPSPAKAETPPRNRTETGAVLFVLIVFPRPQGRGCVCGPRWRFPAEDRKGSSGHRFSGPGSARPRGCR